MKTNEPQPQKEWGISNVTEGAMALFLWIKAAINGNRPTTNRYHDSPSADLAALADPFVPHEEEGIMDVRNQVTNNGGSWIDITTAIITRF